MYYVFAPLLVQGIIKIIVQHSSTNDVYSNPFDIKSQPITGEYFCLSPVDLVPVLLMAEAFNGLPVLL